MKEQLLVEEKDNCVRLTLNRPEKHNAFDDALIKKIHEVLEKLKKNEALKLLTISGSGKSFSAGADLAWMRRMKNYSHEENYQDSKMLSSMLSSLANFPCPTLALINGSTYGGGIGLVACCDIAVSVDSAQFSFSEAKLGLIPAVISPYIIKAIGFRLSQKLFLTAEKFTAQQAEQYGLLHECCHPDELENCYEKYKQFILNNGPNALQEIKTLIQLNERISDIDIHNLMVERIAAIRVTPEAQAGLLAFLEKRQINWSEDI